MNKSFILLDKNNNLQKNANVIVKFSFEGRDYLVYSVEENEQNSQIFVSKIIFNSEGKCFIDNVMTEEKNKLNNIVYNVVILTPVEAQKGTTYEVLSNNLFEKFAVKLSSDVPELGMQEYFSNCSVAITSKILVDAAVKFYGDNLVKKEEPVVVPTWTAPVEATAPTPMNVDNNNSVVQPTQVVSGSTSTIPVQGTTTVSELNLQSAPIVNNVNTSVDAAVPNVVSVVGTSAVSSTSEVVHPTSGVVNSVDFNAGVQPNPQVEKLAVVSDPSLGLRVAQPNIGKNKKAGYANTKYIVIGTVCLVLAIAVVIVAYILIKNMQ